MNAFEKGFLFLAVVLTGLASSCSNPVKDQPLPVLGERDIVDGDTIYHTIPDFAFVNQDSQLVTNQTFAGKAYVADFFFTNCPTICPKVTKQMLRIHDAFKDEDQLLLLAHTIDPKRDTVGKLKMYSSNLEVESSKWHFVTGEKDKLYEIADDYFSIAIENPDVPGGFDHSGRIILVDPQRRVRSFCDGTDPESVTKFLDDIEKLLKEMKSGAGAG
jgi:protein SCO1/2